MSLPVRPFTQVSDGRVSRQHLGAAEVSARPDPWRRQWKSAVHGRIGGRTWQASNWGQSNLEYATACHKSCQWALCKYSIEFNVNVYLNLP